MCLVDVFVVECIEQRLQGEYDCLYLDLDSRLKS